jgi:hypothetical protein
VGGGGIRGRVGGSPNVNSLNPTTTYIWEINLQDSNGNSALTTTQYLP